MIKEITRQMMYTLSLACVCAGLCLCVERTAKAAQDTVVLRICNWEEYLDLGDWDEDEVIDLDSGDIYGEDSMIDDFEEWYMETYGVNVKVEYSTFGSNEELYNQMNLGNQYDLVCPSEYMIMKLKMEDRLEPYSDEFKDTDIETNYYSKGLSPYIRKIYDDNKIDGESWSEYTAGYMWGITGIMYNQDKVDPEDTKSWSVLQNEKYAKRITMKDNVRDDYFVALAILKQDTLLSDDFCRRADYKDALVTEMNDVSDETLSAAEDILEDIRQNQYSYESDSGKADMVSGKVYAGLQWSGDAVYSMDLAEEEDFTLSFSVPDEVTNMYFDGWVMLKDGIDGDAAKKQAAEAFVNFVSRPDNVVRNMYYVGYTSVISGGDDDTIFEYVDWCYGAEDEDTDISQYSLDYFFSEEGSGTQYTLTTTTDQLTRQLFAQYPTEDVLERSAIMQYFDTEDNEKLNQMWINIRCLDATDIPVAVYIVVGLILLFLIGFVIVRKRR